MMILLLQKPGLIQLARTHVDTHEQSRAINSLSYNTSDTMAKHRNCSHNAVITPWRLLLVKPGDVSYRRNITAQQKCGEI